MASVDYATDDLIGKTIDMENNTSSVNATLVNASSVSGGLEPNMIKEFDGGLDNIKAALPSTHCNPSQCEVERKMD